MTEWQASPGRPALPTTEIHLWKAPSYPSPLRPVLARYLNLDPALIELRTGEHGKPRLAERASGLSFNLSHSGRLALVAIARSREVGVDIEWIETRRDFLRLAEIGLDSEAAAAVRKVPAASRAGTFYDAWVRHEAIAKCLGVGLAAPLPPGPVSISPVEVGADYAAAVAVAGTCLPPLRRFSLAHT